MPPSHGRLMARRGRLVWVNYVLRAVPIYAMMAENLLPWACKNHDAICRRFFWAGSDQSTRGKCLVSPEPDKLVAGLLKWGGLGVGDIQLIGYALQFRLAGSGFRKLMRTGRGGSYRFEMLPGCTVDDHRAARGHQGGGRRLDPGRCDRVDCASESVGSFTQHPMLVVKFAI